MFDSPLCCKNYSKLETMENRKDAIALLDYSNGDVVILNNLPTQEYINKNYDGDWEDWLYYIATAHDGIPRIKDCHWMHTSKCAIETITL